MEFNLDREEAEQLRSKYKGTHAEPQEILSTAEELQDKYLPHSAAIGNLTTIQGVQSTKTRRPLSASVDLVIEKKDGIEELGRDYDSWEHMGAYFADVNDLEVGIIYTEEFSIWNFPEETFKNSYEVNVRGHNTQIAEPASNVASKLNRMLGGEVTKNSDAVDIGSHLHWSKRSKRTSIEELARRVEDTVDRPYEEAIDKIKSIKGNFSEEEREELDQALNEFENILMS